MQRAARSPCRSAGRESVTQSTRLPKRPERKKFFVRGSSPFAHKPNPVPTPRQHEPPLRLGLDAPPWAHTDPPRARLPAPTAHPSRHQHAAGQRKRLALGRRWEKFAHLQLPGAGALGRGPGTGRAQGETQPHRPPTSCPAAGRSSPETKGSHLNRNIKEMPRCRQSKTRFPPQAGRISNILKASPKYQGVVRASKILFLKR